MLSPLNYQISNDIANNKIDNEIEICIDLIKSCLKHRNKVLERKISAPRFKDQVRAMRSRMKARRRRYQKERDTGVRKKYFIEFEKHRTIYKINLNYFKKLNLRKHLDFVTRSGTFGSNSKIIKDKNKINKLRYQFLKDDGFALTGFALMKHTKRPKVKLSPTTFKWKILMNIILKCLVS